MVGFEPTTEAPGRPTVHLAYMSSLLLSSVTVGVRCEERQFGVQAQYLIFFLP